MLAGKYSKSIIIIHWLTFLLLINGILFYPGTKVLKLNGQVIKSFYPQIFIGASIFKLIL